MDDFSDIRHRINRATPGVLNTDRNRDGGWDVYVIDRHNTTLANFTNKEDAELASHAADDIRRLLNELEWLRRELSSTTARQMRASAETAGMRAELNAWRQSNAVASAVTNGDIPSIVTITADDVRRLLAEGGE